MPYYISPTNSGDKNKEHLALSGYHSVYEPALLFVYTWFFSFQLEGKELNMPPGKPNMTCKPLRAWTSSYCLFISCTRQTQMWNKGLCKERTNKWIKLSTSRNPILKLVPFCIPPPKLDPRLGLFHEFKTVFKYCQSIFCIQNFNISKSNKNSFQVGLYVKGTFSIYLEYFKFGSRLFGRWYRIICLLPGFLSS